ncbi:pullulanase-type alpha-1,6-glucosidase [Actinomyces minihominis]|uniref:pullulanase-type alpha-1,6-glucosidase n=1 Tax=Actinomyces minihominis TaxID=2002838 RepID=UPI000C07D975|nr:pullulanase-type alpha-1,6-glucosidase [Actinomyces minihominis]
MTHAEENCGCGGDGEWALWLDRSTMAFPFTKTRVGATYRLQNHPEVKIRSGPLAESVRDLDLRTHHADYLALYLEGPGGEPLSRGEAAEILRGPLRLELVRHGRVLARSGIQIARVLDDLYPGASAETLGVGWDSGRPILKLWAPTAQNVQLRLGSGPEAALVPAVRDDNGVWLVEGEADWEDRPYLWEVRVYVPALGSLVTNRVTDPYSVGLSPDSTKSVILNRSRERWTPKGWGSARAAKLRHPAAQSIYELHVRDFSIWDSSVPEQVRGTYRAFLERDSAGIRALRNLVAAGITTLHLLPTYDIATGSIPEIRSEQRVPEVEGIALLPENEEQLEKVSGWSRSSRLQQGAVSEVANQDGFNWGYDPAHWMTPEGSYATEDNQYGGGRTLEYREMIEALHGLGLCVVQDVVFNHTFGGGQCRDSVLDKIVPGYYHRLSPAGEVETSTCCPNVATEHLMAQKLMVDAILDAAVHYRIDGFRFDLMGHHSLQNMLAVRAALDALTVEEDGVDGRSVYLYGEGWNFGEVADDVLFIQATQRNIGGSGIGVFNDRLRDAVRGGNPMDQNHSERQGFATGLLVDPNEAQNLGDKAARQTAQAELYRLMDLVKISLIGAIRDYPLPLSDGSGTVLSQDINYAGQDAAFAEEPSECVNYVEAHDDESLYDSSIWKLPLTTSMEDRVRAQVLANATVALGQGVAFWASGTELMRSKSLDRDSYNSGDWFNAIDWTGQRSQFGRGLPSAGRNAEYWSHMAPLLEMEQLRPDAAAMAMCREQSLELLRTRANEPLLTLGSADEIRARLRFLPTGEAGADRPGVIAMHIDGEGYEDGTAGRGVLVIFNATTETWRAELQVREGVLLSVEAAPRAATLIREED